LELRDRIKVIAYKWRYLENGVITENEVDMFTRWVNKPLVDENNKPVPTPDEYWEMGWKVLLRLMNKDQEFLARLYRLPKDSCNSRMTG